MGHEDILYVGIDPGNTGALAVLDAAGWCKNIVDFGTPGYTDWVGIDNTYKVMLEKVNAMPKQGVSSTFKLGMAYGYNIGMLEAWGISYTFVTPAKWQASMYDSAARTGNTKKDSLALARRLFPELARNELRLEKHHNRSDALLLAEYCRRLYLGIDW